MTPAIPPSPARRRALIGGGLMLALLSVSRGQTAPTPAPVSDQDEVVKMEAFTVSTALGNYAEATSDAATKMPIPIKDLASTVQVLNASFILDTEAKKLDDLYPYVVGLTRSGSNVNDYTLRGFNSGGGMIQFLKSMLIDGLPGLTSRFGSPTTANLEKVEVIKGPSSLLYGRTTPGGLIDMVTKRPQPIQQTSISTSVSTYDGFTSGFGDKMSYSGTVDTTGPIDQSGHWLYRVIANGEKINSFRNNIYYDNWALYPSLTFKPSDDTTFNAEVEISRQSRASDTGLIAPFNNIYDLPAYNTVYQEPTDKEHENGDALALSFQHAFADGWTLHIGTRSTYEMDHRRVLNNNSVKSNIPYTTSTITRILQTNFNFRRYNFGDANAYGTFGSDTVKHTAIVGISGGDSWYEMRRSSQGPSVAPIPIFDPILGVTPYPAEGTAQSNIKYTYHDYAFYASDQVTFWHRTHVTVGGRYDGQTAQSVTAQTVGARLNKQSGGKVVPQLGVLYDITPSVTAYVSYSESYIPVNLAAFDVNDSSNFPPESAKQYEAGVKSEFLDRKANVTLAAYGIKKRNVLEASSPTIFNAAGDPISYLAGAQESRGVELESSFLPVPNWQLQVGGSWMPVAKTTESQTAFLVGLRLPNDPRFSTNFWTRYNVPQGILKGLGAGVGVMYVGARAVGTTAAAYINVPGYTRVDGALYYQWRRTTFALNLYNAFDRKYLVGLFSATSLYPGDPRKLSLSASTKF